MWCEVSQASRGDEPKKWGLCLKPLPGPCPLCSVRMTGPSPLPGRHCVPGLLGQEGPFRGWSHGIAAPGPGPEPPCLSLSPVLMCGELPPAPGTVLLSWTCHHMPGSLGLEKGEHVVTWETSRVSSQESGHERLGGGSPTSGSFSPTGLFFSLWCSDRQSACHSPQGLAVAMKHAPLIPSPWRPRFWPPSSWVCRPMFLRRNSLSQDAKMAPCPRHGPVEPGSGRGLWRQEGPCPGKGTLWDEPAKRGTLRGCRGPGCA